ncbi:MAG: hypothetical protein ACHQK9_02735 [Reyranellales bacterium]
MRHVVSLLGVLALAGCVATPRPFEHDGTDDVAYLPKRDKTEIAIATPANMPTTMAERVAAALAIELQSYGVLAAVQPAPAPLKLAGAMSTRDAGSGSGIEIEIEWFLIGARGVQGPAVSKTFAQPQDYAEASDRLVSRIAQQAAPRVATLMGRPPTFQPRDPGQVAAGLSVPPEEAPIQTAAAAPGVPPASGAKAAAPQPPAIKVAVGSITGAPSDGNRQLFGGMRRALGSNKIIVIDKAGPDTFTVGATVSLTPIDDRMGQLVVKWTLKDPTGKDVGNIEQSNPVPLAAARGSWVGFGDIVASAAVEGVLELLEKSLNKPR